MDFLVVAELPKISSFDSSRGSYDLLHEHRTQDYSNEWQATVYGVDMSDVKAEPASFSLNGLSRYAFGDRWRFGVECEVQDRDVDPWGTLQPFGSFWLWVEGRAIGNTDVSEMLVLGFSTLRASTLGAGRRAEDQIPGTANLDKLDAVRWVGYGDDEDFRPELWGGKSSNEARAEDVQPYWVVPQPTLLFSMTGKPYCLNEKTAKR